MMEWGASRILALRKHASMTQAQFAQWLGVSIKQVKYLEHQRRNPSGPACRLLGILAQQLGFEGGVAIHVLGTSVAQTKLPARPHKAVQPIAKDNVAEDTAESTIMASKTEATALNHGNPVPPPNNEAFVWL
jgi:DNA-binding XRE family transcriptional regulator